MDGRFEIREGSHSDLEEIAALEAVCFENDPWSYSAFEDMAKQDSCKIYVIFDMQLSKTVAYSVIYAVLDQGDLANIAVDPEYRRWGLGSKLLTHTVQKATENGVIELFLEVRASNAPAIGLYEKSGFAKIGTRRNYYKHPKEDAIIMVLNTNEVDK